MKYELQRQHLHEVRKDRREEAAGQYILFPAPQFLPATSKHSCVLEEIRRYDRRPIVGVRSQAIPQTLGAPWNGSTPVHTPFDSQEAMPSSQNSPILVIESLVAMWTREFLAGIALGCLTAQLEREAMVAVLLGDRTQ